MSGEDQPEDISDPTDWDIEKKSRASDQILSVYEVAFQSYQSSDRTLVYELYLGIIFISILLNLIERTDISQPILIFALVLGLFVLILLYYSAWTLELVKFTASNTMKEIEMEYFEEKSITWQSRLDDEITHTAESGDELGWFRFLSSDNILNKLVPTGWAGIHIILIVFWATYAIIKIFII